MTGLKLLQLLQKLTDEQLLLPVVVDTECVISNSCGSDEYHDVEEPATGLLVGEICIVIKAK